MTRLLAVATAAGSIVLLIASVAGADPRSPRGGHLLGPDAGKATPILTPQADAGATTPPATVVASDCGAATPCDPRPVAAPRP